MVWLNVMLATVCDRACSRPATRCSTSSSSPAFSTLHRNRFAHIGTGLFSDSSLRLMFWLAGSMIDGFAVESFWSAFFGSLLYSLISWALSSLLVSGKR